MKKYQFSKGEEEAQVEETALGKSFIHSEQGQE